MNDMMLPRDGSWIASLYPLEVRQWPGAIEIGFGRLVEPKIREPVFAGHNRNPVFLEPGRRFRSAVDIHRTVRVLAQAHTRRTVGALLRVQDQRARVDVVQRDRPEQFYRRVGGDAQAIRSAAVEPISGLVLVGAEIRG